MSAPSGRFEALGEALARAQDDARREGSSTQRAAARARLLDAASEPRPRRVGWIAAPVLALVAIVLVLAWPRADAVPTFELEPDGVRGTAGEWLAAPADAERTLRFSDGSRVALRPRAQARVTELHAQSVRVVLETGAADVHVERDTGRTWRIDAGPYRVRVTGTRFVVAWDPASAAFELDLREGSVIVEGPQIDGEQSVTAGELLRVAGDAPETVAARSPAPIVETAPAPSPAIAEPPAPVPRAPERAPRPTKVEPRTIAQEPAVAPVATWQQLARDREYARALAAAEAFGYDALCEGLVASELLRLADVARFARRPARAREALDAVRRRFPDTDAAATAAFERGRIALAGSDSHAEAASWFDTYLRERPDGTLAREAMGRRMEALETTDRAAARTAARRYLERYPAGPHADLAKRLAEGGD